MITNLSNLATFFSSSATEQGLLRQHAISYLYHYFAKNIVYLIVSYMQEGTTTNYLLDPLDIESQNIKATEYLLIDEENLGEKVREILELELRAFNLLYLSRYPNKRAEGTLYREAFRWFYSHKRCAKTC